MVDELRAYLGAKAIHSGLKPISISIFLKSQKYNENNMLPSGFVLFLCFMTKLKNNLDKR